jgi:hypothetical protein
LAGVAVSAGVLGGVWVRVSVGLGTLVLVGDGVFVAVAGG